MSVDLATEYLERWAPLPKQGIAAALRRIGGALSPYFDRGDASVVRDLLWVLQPLFAGEDQAPFREEPYNPDIEGEVDALLIEWAATNPMSINVPSVAHGRVLYERYRQSLVVIMANEASAQPLLVPRADLPLALRQAAVVLLWLHEIELPWEPGTTTPRG